MNFGKKEVLPKLKWIGRILRVEGTPLRSRITASVWVLTGKVKLEREQDG